MDGGGKGVGKGEIYPLPHPLIPLLLFDPCSPPDTNFFPFLAFCFCKNQMATLIFHKITLSTHLPKLTLLCRLALFTPVKMCIAQTSKFWPRKLCIQFHQKFGKFGFTTNFFLTESSKSHFKNCYSFWYILSLSFLVQIKNLIPTRGGNWSSNTTCSLRSDTAWNLVKKPNRFHLSMTMALTIKGHLSC